MEKKLLLLSPEKMSQFALLHLQAPVLYHQVGVCNFRGQTEIAWPIKRKEEKNSLKIRQRQTFRAVNAFRYHSRAPVVHPAIGGPVHRISALIGHII